MISQSSRAMIGQIDQKSLRLIKIEVIPPPAVGITKQIEYEQSLSQNNCSSIQDIQKNPKEEMKISDKKRKVISTDCTKTVGDEWYITIILNKIIQLNSDILEKLRYTPWIYCVLFFRIVPGIILTIIGVLLFIKVKYSTTTYAVLGVFLGVQFIFLLVACKSLWEACKSKCERSLTFIIFLFVMTMELIICPLLAFIIDAALFSYIAVELIAWVAINIIFELNLVIWLAILPLLILFCIMELLARCAINNTKCPKTEQIVLDCDYRLYPYEENVFIEKLCGICRAPFQRDEYICQLKCNASHIFHEECIFAGLKQHPYCPICRQSPLFAF